MNQFIFKSRWIAISFAVLMLFSAYMLVGDGNDGSVLGQLQGTGQGEDDSQAQLAASGTGEAPPPPVADQSMDEEFVDDGELIDTAEGTDPSADSGEGGDDYGEADNGPQFAPDGVEVIDGDSGESSDE